MRDLINFELTVLRAPLTDFDNFKTTNTFNVSIFISFFLWGPLCYCDAATERSRGSTNRYFIISEYHNIIVLRAIYIDQGGPKNVFSWQIKILIYFGVHAARALLPSRVSSAITGSIFLQYLILKELDITSPFKGRGSIQFLVLFFLLKKKEKISKNIFSNCVLEWS